MAIESISHVVFLAASQFWHHLLNNTFWQNKMLFRLTIPSFFSAWNLKNTHFFLPKFYGAVSKTISNWKTAIERERQRCDRQHPKQIKDKHRGAENFRRSVRQQINWQAFLANFSPIKLCRFNTTNTVHTDIGDIMYKKMRKTNALDDDSNRFKQATQLTKTSLALASSIGK